jgi:hypothetical protein
MSRRRRSHAAAPAPGSRSSASTRPGAAGPSRWADESGRVVRTCRRTGERLGVEGQPDAVDHDLAVSAVVEVRRGDREEPSIVGEPITLSLLRVAAIFDDRRHVRTRVAAGEGDRPAGEQSGATLGATWPTDSRRSQTNSIPRKTLWNGRHGVQQNYRARLRNRRSLVRIQSGACGKALKSAGSLSVRDDRIAGCARCFGSTLSASYGSASKVAIFYRITRFRTKGTYNRVL